MNRISIPSYLDTGRKKSMRGKRIGIVQEIRRSQWPVNISGTGWILAVVTVGLIIGWKLGITL